MDEKTKSSCFVNRHFDTRQMQGLEVEAQRHENSKTFALGKGMYQTVVYPEKVHYLDSKGNWQEIDNHLQPAARGEQALETTSGPLRTRLALRADAEQLVTMRDERGRTLSWRLLGASGVPCTQNELILQGDDEDEKRAHADKSITNVRYSGIFPHTDLICELHGDHLKESFVLDSPDAPAQFRFMMNAQGLAWEQTTDNGLCLRDTAQPDEDVFCLPAPYMIDAAGVEGAVQTEWQTLNGNLCMTITPDAAFLAEARYPVIIDPTVQSAQATTNILDTFVSESNGTTNYGTAQTLRVGKHAAYGQCKALVKIASLPALSSAYTVAKAWIGLAVLPTTGYTADGYLYAHEALAGWSQTTVTWNNQPDSDDKHLDYVLIRKGVSEAKSVRLDITNLVRKWYASSTDNFGVMLDSHEDQAIELCTSENTTYDATAHPVIYVNYISNAGLEDYLTYESFGAGRAGTAYMALHSGNLVVSRGLTAMNGNRLPVSLGLTWNACNKDVNSFGVGKGWRLNWNQNLRRDRPATGDYIYVLTDGDGTEHEFRKHVKSAAEQNNSGFVNYYEDQSGLSLKLYEGTTEAEIVSKDHSKMVFDMPTEDFAGTLTSTTVKMIKRVEDAQNNIASFLYDSSFRLTQVTDGAGRVTSLAYTANDVRITVPGYTQQVVLTLDASQRMTAVTDLDGGRSEYEYGAETADPNDPNPPAPSAAATNRIRLIRNTVNGACVNPIYDGRGRVIQMTAYATETVSNGSGGTIDVRVDGNDRSYTYYDCVTQVRDLTVENGKVLTYQFNDYGNVVAVHDELGFAAFAKFSMGKPNTPEAVSKLQRLSVNLLDRHDFNTNGGWTTGVLCADGTVRKNETAFTGSKPLCLECPASKWLSQGESAYAEYLKTCEAGEHTFSVYTQSNGDVLAWAELVWQDGDQQWHTVTSEQVRRVGSPLRLTCTATLPQAATVRCRVLAGDGTGTAWFDRAQLERGVVASHYNLLQNANFTALQVGEWPEGWIFTDGDGDADGDADGENRATIAVATASNNKPRDLSANCLRMQSAPGRKTRVYQELDVRGEKADNFVVGGWARAWAASSGDQRTFRLRVQFQKMNGVWADGGSANWNEEWVDWQYACGAVVAPADYGKLRISIDYDENLNEAQIGAVSLTKEYYGQNFAYDDKNNITAVSTLLGQKDNAVYDTFDNLTSYIQPGRGANDKYTFFYGDTDAEKKRHLPLRSQTPLGTKTETKYDAHGNATESTARDGSDGRFIRTGTTYMANGNYTVSTTDALGRISTVSIDPNKGQLLSTTDAAGQQVTYQYDAANRITAVEATANAKTYRNVYTYAKDRLATLSHNTTANAADNVTYSFATDALGNQTTVNVGGQVLSTNAYTDTGDKLLESVTYGNGDKVSYTYDSFKRTSGICYDEAAAPRFTYEYGANGAVGSVNDAELNREARMAYDLAERPVEAELYENGALKYHLTQEYDRFEQPSILHERVEEPDNTRSEYTVAAVYDKESKPTEITCESCHMAATGAQDEVSKRKLAYRYDGLGRVQRRSFHANGDANAETGTPLLCTEYGYSVGGYGADSTTAQVQSIEQAGRRREYWYDKRGNITRESWKGMATAAGTITFEGNTISSAEGDTLILDAATLESRYQKTFTYDALSQLLRADNERAGITWTYAYDLGGNMVEKKKYAYTAQADLSALTPMQTVPYAYGDANWKDKLTAFDGKPITYDAIGNPLTYDGWTYTWKAGRMLHSMERGGESEVSAQFTYDHTGLRVKKSVNGVDTLYLLNGKNITHIRKSINGAGGMDAIRMYFFYDAQGSVATVGYNGVDYAYLHNLQGDVVGLMDMDGSVVVEYGYDAWGAPVYTEGSMAATLGRDNPFRYRGYVWDEETGLYYLRSRYYDPSWGRFVNADTQLGQRGQLFEHNLYCYCANAPVMTMDEHGNRWINWVHKRLASALKRFVTSAGALIQLTVNRYRANALLQKQDKRLAKIMAVSPSSAGEILIANREEEYQWFYEHVKKEGEMDYKARKPKWSLADRFNFFGKDIGLEDYGNINYGYIGKALGIADDILYAGGGFAALKDQGDTSGGLSCYFDSQEDHENIQFGIALFE